MAVCAYCENAVIWDEEAIRSAGKQATLPEGFSRLYRGATGKLLDKRFHVLGRVRYSFGSGFWDEWYLELHDASTAWLSDDNHELALQSPLEAPVEPFERYQPGRGLRLNLSQGSFVVQETGQASCLGVEGELPFVIQAGESYAYVDASSPDGRLSLGIEYDAETPSVFLGRWLRHASLELDDEGSEW